VYQVVPGLDSILNLLYAVTWFAVIRLESPVNIGELFNSSGVYGFGLAVAETK
jgi:hypothetical protein